jgi:predicted patatin/cPLA2 family phospholipase
MIFEGNHEVIAAIKEKKRLMDSGQPHEHIRPLMIQGGGLMQGVYGTGAALALSELGYQNVFTSLVGISSGAPIVAYFAAGNVKDGVRVLTEDCGDRRFINPWRFWNQVDTQHFIDILRYDPGKQIKVEEALKHPARMYFGVSRYETAEPELLEPADEEELFLSMHASINMRNVSKHKIVIDGTHYADGGFTKPHIIGHAVKEIDATHVLIVTNNTRHYNPITNMERVLNRTLFRLRLNGALSQAIRARLHERDKAVAEAMQSKKAVAAIWGNGAISSVETRPEKIMATIEASRTWWHGLFGLENQ